MQAASLTIEQESTALANARAKWQEEFERVAQRIREAAEAAGIEDMSMEEIDAEIAAYRKEQRELNSK